MNLRHLYRLEVLIRMYVSTVCWDHSKDNSKEHKKPVDIPHLSKMLILELRYPKRKCLGHKHLGTKNTHPPPKLGQIQGLVNNNMRKQGPGELLPLLRLEEPLHLLDRLLPPVDLGHGILLGENKSTFSP